MSVIDDQCRVVLDGVEGGVGFAVVDLDSTLLFGVAHNVSYFTQEYLDAVAGAAVDMFRGRTITAVETLIASARNADFKRTMQEVQTQTDHTLHFMHIMEDRPDILLVLITGRGVAPEAGWNAVRAAAPPIAAILP